MSTQNETPGDFILPPEQRTKQKPKSQSEKTIEATLKDEAKRRGGWAVKWFPVIFGLPDRIVFAGKGLLFFAELKSAKKKPSKSQLNIHSKIRALGFNVYTIDSLEYLEEVLNKEFANAETK